MVARRTAFRGMQRDAAPWVGADRRRTERVEAMIRAVVRPTVLGDERMLTARAVDIGDNGLRLSLPRRMQVGTEVTIDLECELPLRVHLGYDAHSLVVDGPMYTHLVRVVGIVRRVERRGPRRWDVGIEISPGSTRFDELQVIRCYVDHLREQEAWSP